jgi:hypothetical protein
MRELLIDAFRPFVSDIKRYGLHRLRPGGATTAADYLPQLRYTTSIQYMFIVLFVLLFYIGHCCIDIEDRSLSGQIETWWCDYRCRLDYAMSDRLQNTDTFKKIH